MIQLSSEADRLKKSDNMPTAVGQFRKGNRKNV